MFSFFITVAEGAEGQLDEGRSQEAMDNFFA